ncbi:thioesterase II family protein [Micromonospora endolithica]|uniref:Thioesterase n=1 Tax=Micromonospora endolithica TaxID=230091 RepID=A0A3A9ZQ02_9ACTN|nr:alpha/beta fold hydrolase [Micromonospora endolithica]RKN50253.1 thioesterase [Micromonospora endolithica]TWJ21106.1 surfactin synthase thioesterase subunit [Micromonospora endolithica]
MPLLDGDDDLWLRRFDGAPPDGVRLVCFPHAGGSASYWFTLSRLLRLEVVAVQYPGRQERRREPLIDTITELSDRVFEVIDRLPPRPTAFLGHSMGAVVAFEVAERLTRAHGTGPEHLFVSGRRGPTVHRAGTVHLQDDTRLVAELRGVGGTDPRFFDDPELLETILPVTRNDYRAVETHHWVPGPPLDCPITALVGDHDPQTSVDDARAWSAHTTGEFGLRVFPGGHFYLDAHRPAVAETITVALAGARTPLTFEEAAS